MKPPTAQRIKKPKARKPKRETAVTPRTKPAVASMPAGAMEKLKGLSLRQPWAEEVMRGAKKVEYRRQPVHFRGRIYIYASLGRYTPDEEVECATAVGYKVDGLPRGGF